MLPSGRSICIILSEQGGGRSRVFTGSNNRACDRERVEKIMGRGNGGTILVYTTKIAEFVCPPNIS